MIHSFSLIMATLGRVEEVGRFMESLAVQDCRNFELVIVDQNQDDRLVELVDAYRCRFPILYIKRAKPGLSRARNEGLAHVNGKIVAFPDDDCVYPQALLRHVADFFEHEIGQDGLTVRILDLVGDDDAFGFGVMESGTVDEYKGWTVGVSPGIFLRRQFAEQVAFDEALGLPHSSSEDVDYLLRCIDQGARVYHKADLCVRHPTVHEIYSVWKLVSREYKYSIGFGFLRVKRRVPWWVFPIDVFEPFYLFLKYVFTGKLRYSLPCASMSVGRAMGYWKGMRTLGLRRYE